MCIPYREDSPERARNLAFVMRYYAENFPELEIFVRGDGADGSGPFCKSRAINKAVAATKAKLLIIADTDYVIAPAAITEAIDLASRATWAIPGAQFHLTPESSAEVCSWPRTWPLPMVMTSHGCPITTPGGSLTVIRRSFFDMVGGFDERFAGWGFEDDAFGWAVTTLVGPPRVFGRGLPLMHLWHPREAPPSGDGIVFTGAKVALGRRYQAARGDPEAMRRVLTTNEPAGDEPDLVLRVRRALSQG